MAAEQDLIHKKAAQVLQNANIAVAETLLDDLIKDDAELAKLRLLPGVQPVIDE